ncbi:MAG: DDE-type integrase/transposase/recombinase [bacterium]|nr:DDE-type integrase/transposase/recombinase [bacterium]
MLEDPRMMTALARYQVVSTYLAMAPRHGQRAKLRNKLAARAWHLEDGRRLKVSSGETIRGWVRRYQRKGLAGLVDKVREPRGEGVLSSELIETACALKREVPERSLDRLIEIMEALGIARPGKVRRSTLHRALHRAGLSARKCRTPERADLDRFEADAPNALWQSDMLVGPWLPDPERPGKSRRTYLYAFLDDHSRLLLHGRFSFKGDLPALELVFRRCLQKYGVCRRVYYDNGQVYRSRHMQQIVATLGIHRIIYTQPYRPMGHGKIEALNRLIRAAFISELKASRIASLDGLNEAFLAWADLRYNRRVHTETAQTPLARWRAGLEDVRYADEAQLRGAFLWQERRKSDKTGVLSLFGTRYQVCAELANRRLEVRYDPEALDEVEVWRDGAFVERVRPLDVRAHRRPRARDAEVTVTDDDRPAPVADYLGHLVTQRRSEGFIEPTPRQLAEQAAKERAEADQAVVDLVATHLHDDVFDEASVRAFLARFGPFDTDAAAEVLERLCVDGNDRHIRFYLDALRRERADGGSDD